MEYDIIWYNRIFIYQFISISMGLISMGNGYWWNGIFMKHDKYIMGYLSMNINGILMEHDTMEIHECVHWMGNTLW